MKKFILLFFLLSLSLFAVDQSENNRISDQMISIIGRLEDNFTLTKELQAMLDSVKNKISESEKYNADKRLDALHLALNDLQYALRQVGKEDSDTRIRKIREKLEAINKEGQ